ncbi:hypothetical protein [Microbacterium sp.]|uniref:hypothetical protein n=1 Tax=Microbacterium sp. TaxID=51671 RepID=UPI0039E3FE19
MTRGSLSAGVPTPVGDRLEEARRAFEDARQALDDAREHLLRTHIETARLWGGSR